MAKPNDTGEKRGENAKKEPPIGSSEKNVYLCSQMCDQKPEKKYD